MKHYYHYHISSGGPWRQRTKATIERYHKYYHLHNYYMYLYYLFSSGGLERERIVAVFLTRSTRQTPKMSKRWLPLNVIIIIIVITIIIIYLQEDSGARENGSGSSDILDEVDASGSEDAKTKAAIEHIQEKISRIMGQIKNEQVQKEG